MPSSMEGSSREGDLFTVKHELKNGESAAGDAQRETFPLSFIIR